MDKINSFDDKTREQEDNGKDGEKRKEKNLDNTDERIKVIERNVPDKGFGDELNSLLTLAVSVPLTEDIDIAHLIHIEKTIYPDLVLTKDERNLLQYCTNEFYKLPTSKFAKMFLDAMKSGGKVRDEVIYLFTFIIVPKIRELTGRNKHNVSVN